MSPVKPQIDTFDLEGKKVSKIGLNESIFHVEKNKKLIHQAVVCQLANARQANAHTKTRGEVAGGGRKPWKQKGTGRARAGSSSSPIWVGGGTVFGPTNSRNFSQMINKKMKRKALLMALSDKIDSEKFIVLEKLEIDAPKTKILDKILNNLPSSDGSVLLVLPESNANVELAGYNLPNVKIIRINSLNLVEVLRYEYFLTTKDGLKMIENIFADSETTLEDVKAEKNIKVEDAEDPKKDAKIEKAEKPIKEAKAKKPQTKDKE